MGRHTLADTIIYALTEEIVGKRIAPGSELDESRLAERFGASRTPVREALRQLAASGLVDLRPHRTPMVAVIDEKRIGEMFEVMAELEALCAARAARLMPPAARAALERHHQMMGVAMRAADVDAYRRGNLAFHALIYEGADNQYLRDLALSTRGGSRHIGGRSWRPRRGSPNPGPSTTRSRRRSCAARPSARPPACASI